MSPGTREISKSDIESICTLVDWLLYALVTEGIEAQVCPASDVVDCEEESLVEQAKQLVRNILGTLISWHLRQSYSLQDSLNTGIRAGNWVSSKIGVLLGQYIDAVTYVVDQLGKLPKGSENLDDQIDALFKQRINSSNTDSNTDSNAGSDAGSDAGSNTDSNTNLDAGSNAGSNAGSDTDSESEMGEICCAVHQQVYDWFSSAAKEPIRKQLDALSPESDNNVRWEFSPMFNGWARALINAMCCVLINKLKAYDHSEAHALSVQISHQISLVFQLPIGQLVSWLENCLRNRQIDVQYTRNLIGTMSMVVDRFVTELTTMIVHPFNVGNWCLSMQIGQETGKEIGQLVNQQVNILVNVMTGGLLSCSLFTDPGSKLTRPSPSGPFAASVSKFPAQVSRLFKSLQTSQSSEPDSKRNRPLSSGQFPKQDNKPTEPPPPRGQSSEQDNKPTGPQPRGQSSEQDNKPTRPQPRGQSSKQDNQSDNDQNSCSDSDQNI